MRKKLLNTIYSGRDGKPTADDYERLLKPIRHILGVTFNGEIKARIGLIMYERDKYREIARKYAPLVVSEIDRERSHKTD